jgi:hypothetical protein
MTYRKVWCDSFRRCLNGSWEGLKLGLPLGFSDRMELGLFVGCLVGLDVGFDFFGWDVEGRLASMLLVEMTGWRWA